MISLVVVALFDMIFIIHVSYTFMILKLCNTKLDDW